MVNNGQTQAYTFDLLDTNDDDKGDKIIVHPVTVAKVTYAGAKSTPQAATTSSRITTLLTASRRTITL